MGNGESGILCALTPVGFKEAAVIPSSALPSNSAAACASAQMLESISQAQIAVSIAPDNADCTVTNSESQVKATEATCGDRPNPPPTTLSIADVNDIKLPKPMRKCGRPKGHSLTVIGVPKKRKRNADRGPFRSLPISEKKNALLTWLVGSAAAASALNGRLLEEHEVEVNPALLHCAILDESVDINIAQSYFTDDGWLAVCDTVSHQWQCEACHVDLEEFDSILCDWCLAWFHLPCVSLQRQPKKKLWKCPSCQ